MKPLKGKISQTTTCRKEYKIVTREDFYDWDYGWNFHHKSRHRDLSNHKWRAYKTWKHNRKTKWK